MTRPRLILGIKEPEATVNSGTEMTNTATDAERVQTDSRDRDPSPGGPAHPEAGAAREGTGVPSERTLTPGLEFRVAYTEGEDEALRYHLLVDDRGLPEKLGDGTFGIVFRGENLRGDQCAIKLLYDRSYKEQQANDGTNNTIVLEKTKHESALERFNKEKDAIRLILSALKNRERQSNDIRKTGNISTIVELLGSTENFPSAQLQESFARHNQEIKLSRFALVTELYEGTLKDLLETTRSGSLRTGYGLLKGLDFSQRIEAILPFLNDISDGLATMHRAGYLHLDVKPANVFWRSEGNRNFSAALGDLGYIRKFTEKTVRNELQAALGTQHYRSPEQINFKDFCEARIASIDNDTMTLITEDPKFLDTIMEKGDILKFYKKIENEYEVIDIITDRAGQNSKIIIRDEAQENIVEKNEVTQVEIYKSQGMRTDLCGFGGIFYDLITCGKSPEQFYRFLSALDSEENVVKEIMVRYSDIVGNYSTTDPNISTAFQVFFDPEYKYAPPNVVEMILKCVLHRARGTYYDLAKSSKDPATGAMELVVADMVKLSEQHNGGVRDRFESILFTDQSRRETGPRARVNLREYLDLLQDLGADRLPQRITSAGFLFTKLIQLVREQISESNGFFIAESVPENIDVLDYEKLRFRIEIYRSREEYVNDICLNINKITHKSSNPFSPPEAESTRRLQIRRANSPSKDGARYLFRFTDTSSYFDDHIRVGEVIHTDASRDGIQRVIEVGEDYVVLSPFKKSDAPGMDRDRETGRPTPFAMPDGAGPGARQRSATQDNTGAGEYQDCTYYRWVDPPSYYLSILGVYLYQLFFVGMRSNTISKPAGVQSLEGQLRASPSLRPHLVRTVAEILDTKAFQEDLSPEARFSNLYRRLTALYLVLTIQDLRSVLGEKPLEELNYKWMEVANDIAECFGKSKGYFHDSLDFKSFARTFTDGSTGRKPDQEKPNTETKNPDFGPIDVNLTSQIGEIIRTTWADPTDPA